MLFRLPEYDIAAKVVSYTAIDELSMVHAPSLRLFPRRPVQHVPVARVNVDDQPPVRISPASHSDGGRFNIRAVVADRFDDLVANFDTAAEHAAKAKVRYVQSALDQLTDATGNVVHGGPSWETLMAMLENARRLRRRRQPDLQDHRWPSGGREVPPPPRADRRAARGLGCPHGAKAR